MEESVSSERLERVARKVGALGASGTFGFRSHGGVLGPPLSEQETADFERCHRVTLPAAYRAFVTRIGHGGPGPYGGAGPHHSLLPLSRWHEGLSGGPSDGPLSRRFPVVPGHEYGDDWLGEVGLVDDDEWFPGTIALSHAGCGSMAVLVVTGEGRGRVACTQWDETPFYTDDADFLAWYERWLDVVTPDRAPQGNAAQSEVPTAS